MSLLNTFASIEQIDAVMKKAKNVYFIGIGGIGMRGVAEWTKALGYSVYGADTTSVKLPFATVYREHKAAQIEGMDVVVYTLAIDADNSEYAYAKEKGLPLFSRANYLGFLMSKKELCLSVAGTHGKSTTTAMLGEILHRLGQLPTVVGGAEMRAFSDSFLYGTGKIAVAEACEYKDSFLALRPTVALALNLEEDHTDYFKSINQLESSFLRYLERAETAVINRDDGRLSKLAIQSGIPVVSFSCKDKAADFYAKTEREADRKLSYILFHKGKKKIHGTLPLSGLYNLQNALAAIAAAATVGIPPEDAANALSGFQGVLRRMEYKGSLNGALCYDDYAHHPTEIRAALSSARKNVRGRLFCLFQSHTYTRSASFAREFASALSLADKVALLPIFAAREKADAEVDRLFAETVGAPLFERIEDAAEWLMREVTEGDTVLVLGAGRANEVFSYLPLK